MTVWIDAARAAATANVALLLALGAIWARSYREHRARHTLGLLVFAAFLLVENALWLYFYLAHPAFVAWFVDAGVGVQAGMTLLCGLETVALAFLARITWL